MKMTDGERMVWASAFTGHLLKHLEGKNPPDHLMSSTSGWQKWERGKVQDASEWAWACVENLRAEAEGIFKRFAPSIGEMAYCILERTP